MKKILLILALCACAGSSNAQFANKDTLIKFINKWIRNSAADAFTQLRLNTALIGIVNQADSMGIRKVEVDGTTLRIITIGKDTFAVTLPGGGGGGNTNSNIGSGFRLAVPNTNNLKTLFASICLVADSSTNTNAITFKTDTACLATYFIRRKDSVYYVTPTRLRDTADALRSAIGRLNETFLGSIYNQNTWAALTDFTSTGGMSAAVSGGNITIAGGSGTFTSTLDLNYFTMLERWKMAAKFKVTAAPGGTTYGIGFGIHSTNGYGQVNAVGRIDLSNSGSTGGKVILNGHTDNQQMAISPSALTITNGDTIELYVERIVDSLKITAINRSNSNQSVSTGFAYDLVTGIPQLPNTGRFAIFALGGTQTIDSLVITSEEIKNATLAVEGDSKTQGYYAQQFSSRYSSQLNTKLYSTVLHAGGYDRTTEWLTTLPEIKALSPKQVLLTNPSNDKRSGISDATSEANYEKIVDSLESWGIDVFHALSFYETSQDNSSWNTFIEANYPASHIIDTWSPIKNGTGMVDGDGVHLTQKANDTIFKTIIGSYKIRGGSRLASNSADGGSFIQNQTSTTQSAGFKINGASTISNQMTLGNATQGSVQLNVLTGPDHKYEMYAYSNINNITSINNARDQGVDLQFMANDIIWTTYQSNTATEMARLKASGNMLIGTTTDNSYRLKVTTPLASIADFGSSNASGFYQQFNRTGTPVGYIGFGSALTTSAHPDDMGLRSMNDTFHFSDHNGDPMVSISNGHVYIENLPDSSTATGGLLFRDAATGKVKLTQGEFISATITTTDATPTTAYTITTVPGTKYTLEVTCDAIVSDESGAYGAKKVKQFLRKTISLHSATLVDLVADQYMSSLSTATFDIVDSGTNVIIQATGETSKTINWKFTIRITQVTI